MATSWVTSNESLDRKVNAMRVLPRALSATTFFHGCVCAGILWASLGCSGTSHEPARFPVSGTVELDGTPIQSGTITFIPEGATRGPSAGATITEGRYSIPAEGGPVHGAHKVQINAPRKTGKQIPVGSPSPPGTMMDETVESIPAQYNSDSTLKVTIGATPTHDFRLTAKP